MMNKTGYSDGPKSFGTATRKSWFDEGDRSIPGPGSNNNQKHHRVTPPTWKFGKDTTRDTFLDKHPVPNPAPNNYQPVFLDLTHEAHPHFSIPRHQHISNQNKVDEGSVGDYKPVLQSEQQHYSFGYATEMDYSSVSPPPNTYSPTQAYKEFNTTQRSFSISQRPMPYGEEGKYPAVGKYNVTERSRAPQYSIGSGTRPNEIIGADSPGLYYDISSDMKNYPHGKSLGPTIPVAQNKDQQSFPAPNKYNVPSKSRVTNIITLNSKRSQMKNIELAKYPSPNSYAIPLEFSGKPLSMTKQIRQFPVADENPGVGNYKVEHQYEKTFGYMGVKVKKPTDFITPSAFDYHPQESAVRYQPQRSISFTAQRSDFSKSITGFVGPACYENTRAANNSHLGVIGNGPKFPPNKNKNPGPGYYNIPNQIGQLPKYFSGPRKVTYDGFSCTELARAEKRKFETEKRQVEAEKVAQEILQDSNLLQNSVPVQA